MKDLNMINFILEKQEFKFLFEKRERNMCEYQNKKQEFEIYFNSAFTHENYEI